MKLGVEVQIDVTKIDKGRLYAGKDGAKYLTMTTFIDTEKASEYGSHGFISEKQTKEEKDSKAYTTILGNCKVFWTGESESSQQPQQQQTPQPEPEDDDQIPF